MKVQIIGNGVISFSGNGHKLTGSQFFADGLVSIMPNVLVRSVPLQ